jgi:histidyl-tRNA synthetase
MNLRAVKGMNDILPDEIDRWHRLEDTFRATAELCGYAEARTPVVEPTPLFVRSIGEVTDIVEKEMYSFERHGDPLTLRPEGTAGITRAYIEHNVQEREPVSRWYYLGPMFRAERPQKGRYRQFYQAGCEVFGEPGPSVDAEMIDMLAGFMVGLGITDVTALVNTLGGPETRARYREALVSHLTPMKSSLGETSQRRLETNPLRILDSKDPRDHDALVSAPSILDSLGDQDRAHFDGLRKYLDRLGTPYVVAPRLVRGFDYYTGTLFEVQARGGDLGAQNALGGGGRYDRMVGDLGGPPRPAIGFAIGLERVLLAMPESAGRTRPLVVLAPMGEAPMAEALVLARALRKLGVAVDVDGRNTGLKGMLRRANAIGATHVGIVGDSEIERRVVQIKDLGAHTQEDLSLDAAAEILAGRLVVPARPTGGA